ncbi:hypothetical protein AMATHDRAFT_77876 [Amanita thiersii Skay4041]|uniref:glutathione transferase n=1 Tax=Amanita thiersii Skay4041 TaxID=703135 RepID=A0A2A9NCF5_9AGAR|nr:hypothetical protein AMATHDRAFT_77876 [Amanita thiersii Skay4041]
MVLKLYGFSISTCSRRVGTVLHEKNVPFELYEVDLGKEQHKSLAHLEKQPFGQIPYIDDDGFILYESRAICRYIATKYASQGTPLISIDPKANALFEQAASIDYQGLPTDEALVQKCLTSLDEKLEVYDKVLSKQRYLGGNELTLADLFHLPYGTSLALAGSDLMTNRPNVTRWFNNLVNRPSWQTVEDSVKATA